MDNRLLELLDLCARYGVCLTVGQRLAVQDGPWPSLEVSLTRAITQRILNAESVDDALKLLNVAQFELGEFCKQVTA